jgi:hypothetical protein
MVEASACGNFRKLHHLEVRVRLSRGSWYKMEDVKEFGVLLASHKVS